MKDFMYFRDHQLHSIDFTDGTIDVVGGRWNKTIYQDVGSKNHDGYIRIWCNRKLRMKHRLIYFLYHNELPGTGEEIDHYDNIRWNNEISNLRVLTKALNNTACNNRKIGRFTVDKIHQVCKLLQETTKSDEIIAGITKVSRATVRDIKTRRSRLKISQNYSWVHRGY